MSTLTIDTAAMQACMYNGNSVEKLIIDGTTVWENSIDPVTISFDTFDIYTYLYQDSAEYAYYSIDVLTNNKGKLELDLIPNILTTWFPDGNISPYCIAYGYPLADELQSSSMSFMTPEGFSENGSSSRLSRELIAARTFTSRTQYTGISKWTGCQLHENTFLREYAGTLAIKHPFELFNYWPFDSTEGAIIIELFTDPGSAEDPYSENKLCTFNLSHFRDIFLERLFEAMPYLSIDRDLPSQVMEVNSYGGQSPCTVYFEDIIPNINIEPNKLHILETMLGDATPDSPVFLGIRISIEGTLFFPSTASIVIDPNIEASVSEAGYYWLDSASSTLDEGMLCSICELDIEPGYMVNLIDYSDPDNPSFYVTPVL